MDYTSKIQHDLDCNYLDLSKDNASNIILGCINKPKSQTINNKNVVEGFAADYSSGVRYIPKGECPVGYKKKEDGCYQVCKSCNYSDKLIEKVLYSEESKELLNEDSFNYAVTDVDWDLNQNGDFIS
tara:strand:- start:2541 stop:2921 length:381 start_codon:yes stop_codon:yes gene_type:complete